MMLIGGVGVFFALCLFSRTDSTPTVNLMRIRSNVQVHKQFKNSASHFSLTPKKVPVINTTTQPHNPRCQAQLSQDKISWKIHPNTNTHKNMLFGPHFGHNLWNICKLVNFKLAIPLRKCVEPFLFFIRYEETKGLAIIQDLTTHCAIRNKWMLQFWQFDSKVFLLNFRLRIKF